MKYPVKDFHFEWTTKDKATHAIRKRDSKKQKAGGELEGISNQTSSTHYFLKIDMEHIETKLYMKRKIPILFYINYEYVYKGTNEEALNHYITKADFIDIFQNIDLYNGNVKRIEREKPEKDRKEKLKEKRRYIKKQKSEYEKTYGKENAQKLFDLIIERQEKESEKKQIDKQIRSIDRECVKIALKIKDNKVDIDIEKIIRDKRFKMVLDNWNKFIWIYKAVKAEWKRAHTQRVEAKTKNGKTLKATRGRPPKNETKNQ
jgi:hypothetical protein